MASILSTVDSERFGLRIARVVATSRQEMEEALHFCRTADVDMLVARIPTDRPECLDALAQARAKLMDTLLEFSIELDPWRHAPVPRTQLRVRYAKAADSGPCASLAADIFQDYPNHYYNDSRLDRDAVAQVYPSWVARASTAPTPDEQLLIASSDTEDSALGIVRYRPGDVTGDISLFGVKAGDRGAGTGPAFLGHLLGKLKSAGARQATYFTQVTNVAAQRMLARKGFLPRRSQYTFHCWLT